MQHRDETKLPGGEAMYQDRFAAVLGAACVLLAAGVHLAYAQQAADPPLALLTTSRSPIPSMPHPSAAHPIK